MPRFHRVIVAGLATVTASSTGPIGAQRPTTPAARDSASPYRYDLARYLFATPQAERTQRAQLVARFKELEARLMHATGSAPALYRALVLADSVSAEARRHSTYLYVRSSQNTLDEESATAG